MNEVFINGLFAIAGATIGVMGTWYINNKNKPISKLTILKSNPSCLLDVEDVAKSLVEIRYNETPITSLYLGQVAIQNTGTTSLESLEAKIIPCANIPLFDAEIDSTNFYVKDKSLNLKVEDSGEIVIKIDYLNPSDRVVISYRTPAKERPEVAVRKLGVDVELRNEAITWVPDIYANLIFQIFEELPILQWYFKRISKPYRLYLEANKGLPKNQIQ